MSNGRRKYRASHTDISEHYVAAKKPKLEEEEDGGEVRLEDLDHEELLQRYRKLEADIKADKKAKEKAKNAKKEAEAILEELAHLRSLGKHDFVEDSITQWLILNGVPATELATDSPYNPDIKREFGAVRAFAFPSLRFPFHFL